MRIEQTVQERAVKSTGLVARRYDRRCCCAALIGLLLASMQAGAADAPPQVASFSPEGSVKGVRQVTARFTTAMVAFGDPRLPQPFIIDCAAAGHARWADSRNWVYDFDAELPAGLSCRFTLTPTLHSLDGVALGTAASFHFDTGGPAIRASVPDEGDSAIDGEQNFILALDAAVDAASVAAHASCAIDNVAEKVPLIILDGEPRAAVLAQRRQLGYQYFSVLWKSGHQSVEKVAREDLVKAEEQLLVVHCQRPLPPNTGVRLVWGPGVATPGGLSTTQAQTLAFRTRPAFNVRLECERVNAHAPCLPLRPLHIVFSAPVAASIAAGLRVVDHDGRQYPQLPPPAGTQNVEDVTIPGPFPEHATLSVRPPATLTDDAGRPADNAARFPLEIKFDGYPPLAKFAGNFGILETRTGGVLPVTLRKIETAVPGQRNLVVPAATAQSLRIDDPGQIAEWLRRVDSAMAPSGAWQHDAQDRATWREDTGSHSVFAQDTKTETFTLPNPGGDRRFQVIGIPLEKPGFYVVELESHALGAALLGRRAPRYVATAALVTNLAVHFAWGRESSLVWVTTLDGARPVAGAHIDVADYCSGSPRWAGTTGADGTARIPTTLGDPHGGDYCAPYASSPLIVTARTDDDLSFTLSQWNRGITPQDFSMPQGDAGRAVLAHTVLDRTLFRAGETVSMKHFLRQHVTQGVALAPASGAAVIATVTHVGSGDQVEVAASFDGNGVATSSWNIPAEAKLGEYAITLARQASGAERIQVTTAKFRVEQFRVPSMKAVLQAPPAALINPGEVPLDVYVGYLSGGGASHAAVKLRTQLEPRTVSFKHYDDFTFGGPDVHEGVSADADDGGDPFAYYLNQFGAYREQVANGAAQAVTVQNLKLDAQGSARVKVPGLQPSAGAQNLVAELEYQDANGERLATSVRVPLWPAAIALGIKVEDWAGTRDKLRFHALALDLQGAPAVGRQVAVDLFQRVRSSYRKRLIGGFYAYETTTDVKRLAASCAGRTDTHGELSCELAPNASGELVLRVRADDGAGNTAVASATAWVAGADEWWFKPGQADRIDVLPERKEYTAGEVARFQVRMPFRHATALVAVEREGVIDHFVTELNGTEPIISVPIKSNYAPNVYVSVLAVRGRVSWWRAALGSVVRYFDLPWPVDGALPTALVDLSKPAYRLGIGRINVDWKSHRLEVEVKPAQAVYNVRQNARVDIAVTRADGQPLVVGTEVALTAVDEGLLELSRNDTWDLLAGMMGQRGLEVLTSTAQMQVVGKRHFGRKAVPHGGGGGRGAARERFDTLLAWQGRVVLDDNGHAQVDIPLNDSLTAFRIVAVAHSGVDHFGTGAATIRTTQDLMLHAGLPPLVRETDRYDAIFTLRNTTDRNMLVDASATATPAAGAATALPLPAQSVALAPGAAQDLVWPATAPVAAVAINWDVRVAEQGGSASDHLAVVQQVVPAYPVRVYQATLTQIDKPFNLKAAPPADAISGRGGVQVALRAHLGDGLESVREYMAQYSYVCLEQNLSRAVALRDHTLWQGMIERLPNYLDHDGLARYFPSEWLPGSDTLTSYILALAAETDWAVADEARTPMINALKKFVAGKIVRDSAMPTTDLSVRKLAAISALARYGAADAAMLTSITIEPNLWPTSAVLDWIDILQRVDNIAQSAALLARASTILRSRINFQGTRMSFATERNDALWWLMISGDVNATRAVLTFLHDPAWQADIPRMVRGALARQAHGHWNTTPANAWGVLALEKFSAAFETQPVNGQSALVFGTEHRTIDWATAANKATVDFSWHDAPTKLSVAHHGQGRPWAMIASRAALPLTAPLFTGYSIKRELTPVAQKTAGVWSRGDVARVTLTVDAQTDSGWVVVDDPIPAGASILGTGLGADAQLLTQGEQHHGWVHPAYEERRFDAFRAYYSFVPQGRWTVEYTVRFNNPGQFVLPATRVEAMYAPEMFGELPNAALEVLAP